MIFVTKFRANDLNPSKGKQIEFNKGVVDSLFGFSKPHEDAEFECCTLANPSFRQRIQVNFTLSPARGDYKVYQNADGSMDLKDYFLSVLHLTSANLSDYYAIKKKSAKKYILYYIPATQLASDFFKQLTADQLVYFGASDDDEAETSPDSKSTAQTIFYGCPGTGKSFKVKGLTEGHDGTKAIYFDKETGKRIDTPDTEEERMSQPSNVFRTTFHPDYDYSTFVGAYKPQMKTVEVMVSENNENTTVKEEVLRYTFVPQVFTNAYVRAWKSLMDDELVGEEKNVYLIIEEINRGNCAQIFGDLFQLLDRSDGNSDYAIIPDEELRKHLEEQGVPSSRLRLPANLHIYATMNTSDQSLFPMDSAFKRRWEMEYIPINLKHDLASTYTIEFDGHKFMWTDFLKAVNTLIRKATDSEDKQMGEFFVKNKVINLAEFKNKVLFYIWNDVCKDLYGASRVSPLYFMRDTEKTIFTFAELYSGRTNEDETVTEPIDLIIGFMNYLKVEDKGTAAKKGE